MNDSRWYQLEQGKQSAAYNMALDEALLECAPELGQPVLRFYGWIEAAASFGYAQKYAEIEKWTLLRPLVRRPTGGGLVPHDADWTYSVTVPPSHSWYQLKAVDSYRVVHEWIRDAFDSLNVPASLAPSAQKDIPGQCFVGAEKFDVLWHGRKIAGAAQRRTKTGLLIQGSVQPPPIPISRAAWQTAMCETASRQRGVNWNAFEMTGRVAELTANLAEIKYSQNAYNQKR